MKYIENTYIKESNDLTSKNKGEIINWNCLIVLFLQDVL